MLSRSQMPSELTVPTITDTTHAATSNPNPTLPERQHMNRQNRINHLLQARTNAEQVEAAYQAELTRELTGKLERLAGVIRSVAWKANELRDKLTTDDKIALGDLIWARRRIVVEDFSETGITVALHSKDGSRPPRDREQIRIFPWELLSLSDRDMAKLTRATIIQERPAVREKQMKDAKRTAAASRTVQNHFDRNETEAEQAYHRAVARKAETATTQEAGVEA